MPTNLSIVVVEDNELVREEMVSFLTRPGWVAAGVDCGEALSEWLTRHTPHIAVLDVNLPYEDGYSIATRLRESHPAMGIIMLTARVRHVDRSTGYQSGADVYLTKPAHTDELIAVIENLGRRIRQTDAPALLLSRQQGLLTGPSGDTCHLTPSETRLLELLILSSGREADSDYLVDALAAAGGKVSTRENLSVLISRLRSKSQQLQGVGNLLLSHRGIGYRLGQPIQLAD